MYWGIPPGDLPMSTISQSVGKGGINIRQDVVTVQQLLKNAGLNPGAADGICGPKTIATILQYQRQFLPSPDGRIDPNGTTWKRLANGAAPGPPKKAQT